MEFYGCSGQLQIFGGFSGPKTGKCLACDVVSSIGTRKMSMEDRHSIYLVLFENQKCEPNLRKHGV